MATLHYSDNGKSITLSHRQVIRSTNLTTIFQRGVFETKKATLTFEEDISSWKTLPKDQVKRITHNAISAISNPVLPYIVNDGSEERRNVNSEIEGFIRILQHYVKSAASYKIHQPKTTYRKLELVKYLLDVSKKLLAQDFDNLPGEFKYYANTTSKIKSIHHEYNLEDYRSMPTPNDYSAAFTAETADIPVALGETKAYDEQNLAVASTTQSTDQIQAQLFKQLIALGYQAAFDLKKSARPPQGTDQRIDSETKIANGKLGKLLLFYRRATDPGYNKMIKISFARDDQLAKQAAAALGFAAHTF